MVVVRRDGFGYSFGFLVWARSSSGGARLGGAKQSNFVEDQVSSQAFSGAGDGIVVNVEREKE